MKWTTLILIHVFFPLARQRFAKRFPPEYWLTTQPCSISTMALAPQWFRWFQGLNTVCPKRMGVLIFPQSPMSRRYLSMTRRRLTAPLCWYVFAHCVFSFVGYMTIITPYKHWFFYIFVFISFCINFSTSSFASPFASVSPLSSRTQAFTTHHQHQRGCQGTRS